MQLIFGRFVKKDLIKKTHNKEIWLLQNTTTGQRYVGKFQPKTKLGKIHVKNVLHEASFLQQLQGHTGIPLMYWSGVEGNQILVISQYLGASLQERFDQCGGKLSLKTVCMIGINLIKILRNLHEKGIIHRNLTTQSIQFGRGLKSSQYYFSDLIDCKRYRNKKSYIHLPQKKNIKYSYENQFAPKRLLSNEEISRIDDIQNLVKVLIYLQSGKKPFKNGQYSKNADIPPYLQDMLKECYKIPFADEPNYQWFVQKMHSQIYHCSKDYDEIYDWMVNRNRLDRLRVKKYIPSLKLDDDKDLLGELYDPIEQSIDIDEVTSKHYKYYEAIEVKNAKKAQQSRRDSDLQMKIHESGRIKRSQKNDCSIM